MISQLRREYVLGEARRIDWELIPNNKNDVVIITSARYEVVSANGNIIKQGNADINGRIIGFLFTADVKGHFVIKLYATVPPETVETELIAVVR